MQIISNQTIFNEKKVSLEMKKEQKFEQLYSILKDKKIVKVKVLELKKNVWKLDINGIAGGLPFERSGLEHPNQMSQFVGQDIYVVIESIRKNPDLVIADRKKALEMAADMIFSQLQQETELVGTIIGVGDHVLHVDIGGGYPVSLDRKQVTLSTSNRSLREYYRIGDYINVIIEKINKETKEIQGINKEVLNNPWQIEYEKNDVVTAKVIRINSDKNIIFVEVKPGLDAYVVLPNLPSFEFKFEINDKIQGTVLHFSNEERKFLIRYNQHVSI